MGSKVVVPQPSVSCLPWDPQHLPDLLGGLGGAWGTGPLGGNAGQDMTCSQLASVHAALLRCRGFWRANPSPHSSPHTLTCVLATCGSPPHTKAVVDCGEISFPLKRIISCIYRQESKILAAGVSWAFPFTGASKVGCGAGKEPSLCPDLVLSQKHPLQIERGWKTGSLRHRRRHLGAENSRGADEDGNIFWDFP